MISTTLNKIREYGPCETGWEKLLKYLGKTKADDDPLSFLTILESNGFDNALWCVRVAPEDDKEWRLFAVWCARRVQHLMIDERSVKALDVAEAYANGLASEKKLIAAKNAAWDAAWDVAWDAERAAARDAASAASWDAAWDAAWAAESAAASAAAWAAAKNATNAAARDAAWAAAWAAARDAQQQQFIKIITEN